MVVKAAAAAIAVTNGKVIPARGPQHLGKIQLRERRFIRSMVGVDSKNVGVQAELDPEMTLRNLHDAQHDTEKSTLDDSLFSSSSLSSVPLVSQSDGRSTLVLPTEFDLPSNFASLAIIHIEEHHVSPSASIGGDH